MSLKKYYITAGLLALILSPVAVTIGLFGLALIVTPLVTLALVWVLFASKASLPESASKVFLPIFLAFCYYMCVWIVVLGISNYQYDSDLFGNVFFALTFPYFIINSFLSFTGDFSFFPLINAAITAITVLTIIITCAVRKRKLVFDKRVIIYGFVFILLLGIAAFQDYDRSTKILSNDSQAERIQEEVNTYSYRPFGADGKDNSNLAHLNEPATIFFTENYPRLDGATAAYPVYAAMVQELYEGLDRETVEQYVACSKTNEAYERLIHGEIDIFFGAQPSKQQIEAAREQGIEFVLTPIAQEAFVFFVNKDNPVNSLTHEQIQNIYQKKIVNWRDVGGSDEAIMPFQRPENSGSQTIMLALVMGDKPLPPPLWEEYAAMMGGIISQVAEYRNYSSAIGYSFRYFATGMEPNDNIKLLAVDGIVPTAENIRNGAYAFTIDVYAVTAGSTNENTEKLIQWILSEQGQNFIELCGYVKTRG